MTYGDVPRRSNRRSHEDRACHKRPVGLRGYDVSDTLAHGLIYIPAPGNSERRNYCATTVGTIDNKDKLNALALAALLTMMVTQALPY